LISTVLHFGSELDKWMLISTVLHFRSKLDKSWAPGRHGEQKLCLRTYHFLD
jgi:hypothetical protein